MYWFKYRRCILGHYEIPRCDDVDKLIRKRKDNSEDPTHFAHN